MNAIDLLRADHKTVVRLLEMFKDAGAAERPTRRELLRAVLHELHAHAAAVEAILYPIVAGGPEPERTSVLLNRAREEHRTIRDLLGEMQELDPNGSSFDVRLRLLRKNVERHVAQEEGEILSRARSQLSSEQLEELGFRLSAYRQARIAAMD